MQIRNCDYALLLQLICSHPNWVVVLTRFACMFPSVQVALKLIETFTEKCEDPAIIAAMYVPAMMDPILGDYQRAVPDARWAHQDDASAHKLKRRKAVKKVFASLESNKCSNQHAQVCYIKLDKHDDKPNGCCQQEATFDRRHVVVQ